MRSAWHPWLAAVGLVTLGWLASPAAVPVYDGLNQPDEPYRYVAAPAGVAPTKPATTAVGTTPVSGGASTTGLTTSSAEVGPQATLFVPVGTFAAAGGAVTVRVTPQAPDSQPANARIDGNVYRVTATDPAGPVTITAKAALATLYLRATTGAQPGPAMEHRASPADPWTRLSTSRGGTDIYVSFFVGAGDYALAFADRAAPSKGGLPVLPLVLGGVVVVLAAVVVAVRLRGRAAAP